MSDLHAATMSAGVRPYFAKRSAGFPEQPNLSWMPRRLNLAYRIAGEDFRHGRAEAADDGVFLDAYDRSALSGHFQDAFGVERLLSCEHSRHDALMPSLERASAAFSASFTMRPVAMTQTSAPSRRTLALPGMKGRVLRRECLDDGTRDANVDGAVDFGRRKNRLFRLEGIAGHENRHVGHDAHEGYVLDALMASAVFAHREPRMGKGPNLTLALT